ncbi:unnamed protein product, partial [Linum tenue]
PRRQVPDLETPSFTGGRSKITTVTSSCAIPSPRSTLRVDCVVPNPFRVSPLYFVLSKLPTPAHLLAKTNLCRENFFPSRQIELQEN